MTSPQNNDQTSRPDARALPAPTAKEQAQLEKLTQLLRQEIAAGDGSIPFDRFMDLALYAPGLGYYAAGKYKFGKDGDFITAPELGSVFARCLARPCRQILQALGGGDILEVGAGRGALAADLLLELETLGQLPDRYCILDISADLLDRQKATLQQRASHLLDRVQWLDALPSNFRGLVLGNEILDAMPVTRFSITQDGIHEQSVGWEQDRFIWQTKPASQSTHQRINPLNLDIGYTSEINWRAEAWIRSLAEVLEQGCILLFDYGFPRAEFYHPERRQGTLMCHYKHLAHDDPLRLVGLQDITTHVDFTSIANAGREAGLTLSGYTSQAAFLLGSGLEEMIAASNPESVRDHLTLTQQIKKLTLPHEMGELYKVIGFERGLATRLSGFQQFDRRDRLA